MGHRWSPLLLLGLPGALGAQAWNAPPTLELVSRAIARRSVETESSRHAYRARAHGVVTFRAEVGPPETPTTRLLKADELDVEVYWQGGDRSKQVIRSWRDTTFFPTGIHYHRDHLGIVTDDFGRRIRIGEGDEVAEVPHPLGPDGLAWYEFRARDTVRIAAPSGGLTLVAVEVRPRDPGAPLAIGTLYLESDGAVLVRSQFTFTASAYRDPDLEDISVRLERALVEGRVWLPYRQEVEVRRRSAILQLPLRSVIRGRWEIADYELDAELPPATFAGPPIGGLARPGGPSVWTSPIGRLLDSIPPAGGSDLDRLRSEARRLVRGRSLEGLPRVQLSAGRVSDLVRVNRVQGLFLGAGVRWQVAPPIEIQGGFGVGTADGRVTGSLLGGVALGRGRLELGLSRNVADVSDLPIGSGLIGSVAAQEGGRDYGDYVLLERVGLGWRVPAAAGLTAALDVGREWSWSLVTEATPARGSYRPNPALGTPPYWVGRLSVEHRSNGFDRGRSEATVSLEAGAGPSSYGRILAGGEAASRIGPGELVLRGVVGAGTSRLPARRSLALGGRGTLPGERHRAFGGSRVALLGAEWLVAVPAPALSLGWFGRTTPELRVGPLVRVGWAGGSVDGAPWRPSNGARPVVGLAVEVLDRAFRLEIGWAMRGRGLSRPGVTFDVARTWWPIL